MSVHRYIITSNYFLRQDYLSVFCTKKENVKCRYLYFTEKVTENYFPNEGKFLKIGTYFAIKIVNVSVF